MVKLNSPTLQCLRHSTVTSCYKLPAYNLLNNNKSIRIFCRQMVCKFIKRHTLRYWLCGIFHRHSWLNTVIKGKQQKKHLSTMSVIGCFKKKFCWDWSSIVAHFIPFGKISCYANLFLFLKCSWTCSTAIKIPVRCKFSSIQCEFYRIFCGGLLNRKHGQTLF